MESIVMGKEAWARFDDYPKGLVIDPH